MYILYIIQGGGPGFIPSFLTAESMAGLFPRYEM